MRAVRPIVCLALAAALAACGSTGGGAQGKPVDVVTDAPAATGNVMVTIKTWNRNRDAPTREPAVAALVNKSSETGRLLTSGKRTSTKVRVLQDEEMGRLLATLDAQGFSSHARQGATFDDFPDDGRRRGVIVVERDGSTAALDYLPGAPEAETFRTCRNIILQVHEAIGGFEVRATTNAGEDPERMFQAQKARLPR